MGVAGLGHCFLRKTEKASKNRCYDQGVSVRKLAVFIVNLLDRAFRALYLPLHIYPPGETVKGNHLEY